MHKPVSSPYRVPFDGGFSVAASPTEPPQDAPGKAVCKERLGDCIDDMRKLQRKLYAQDRNAVLLVFQAMDAAGKDGTIRAVMSGINPQGCQVFSFKQPSKEELDHDFLWRTTVRLPERGRIGIFNRSHYEEVLVVRVHPEYLDAQRLPEPIDHDALWAQRYAAIRSHEAHLAHSGTVILKFFLNLSRDQQKRRFLRRIDDPHKNWKFSAGDVEERALWPKYMEAYEAALNETSRPVAPWYAIPADDKPYMRWQVADIVTRTLDSMDLEYPRLPPGERAELAKMRERLENE